MIEFSIYKISIDDLLLVVFQKSYSLIKYMCLEIGDLCRGWNLHEKVHAVIF